MEAILISKRLPPEIVDKIMKYVHRLHLQEVHKSLKKVKYAYWLKNPPDNVVLLYYKKKTKWHIFHGMSNGYQEDPLICGQTLAIGFKFVHSYSKF